MVAILVLAAVVTPPDVVTQVILFTVVYGLYEISILLVKRVEKKRVQRLRAEGILGEDEDLYRGRRRRRGREGVSEPLDRIAAALERMAPAPLAAPDFDARRRLRLARLAGSAGAGRRRWRASTSVF